MDADELERRRATLKQSWDGIQRILADPASKAMLMARLAEINKRYGIND